MLGIFFILYLADVFVAVDLEGFIGGGGELWRSCNRQQQIPFANTRKTLTRGFHKHTLSIIEDPHRHKSKFRHAATVCDCGTIKKLLRQPPRESL